MCLWELYLVAEDVSEDAADDEHHEHEEQRDEVRHHHAPHLRRQREKGKISLDLHFFTQKSYYTPHFSGTNLDFMFDIYCTLWLKSYYSCTLRTERDSLSLSLCICLSLLCLFFHISKLVILDKFIFTSHIYDIASI